MDPSAIIELLKSVLFGIVEGLTEWLPISSTGHLILLQEFVTLDVSKDFWDMFMVVIQLGAILAICVLYFTQLNPWARSKTPAERHDTWATWGKILVGIIPAAVVGIPLNSFMEEHLSNWQVVSAALIFYGIVFIVIETWRARKIRRGELGGASSLPRGKHFSDADRAAAASEGDPGIQTMDEVSLGRAFGIGCFQVLSLVPGTSRSGSTIIGGLLLGCSRTLAAEYSFYMAIPVMFGASALRLVKYFAAGNTFTGMEVAILLVGMVVAFLTSVLSVKFLMRFIKTNDFKPFGVYRIVLGVVVIAYFLLAR
jgi:undecaprenyl-diphosphatase